MESKKKNFSLLLVILPSLLVSTSLAQLLPQHEVETLQTIFDKLHVKDLNISQNSCSNGGILNVTIPIGILKNVTCGINGSDYHITQIQLKGQNLTGTIPAEFANLSYLREIDLTRNYISGSIPADLSKLPLSVLILLGNRISGPIPKEIGDIATLEELVLEDNKLDGPLPQNLGSLSNLRRLLLSANNFTGTIPETFINLKNLTDFRIDGNDIRGKIPDFIGNWTNIERLDMQGTSMEGPIPDTISQLTIIKQLRISDLNGSVSKFPDFRKMKILKTLILRNCKVIGSIPDYISELSNLKLLDLSFNMLTGQIPNSLQSLDSDYMFLNGNSLSGAVPNWVYNSQNNIDISYNNFNESSSQGCEPSRVNVVSSHMSTGSNSLDWCLKKDMPCSKSPKYYSLFINCGGEQVTFGGNEYEDDLASDGPSYFFSSSQKWAYSSSGVFMGLESAPYKARNTFSLNMTGPGFYQTARLAPSSLKYYGHCLLKGSYKVRLHFAEIMYSNDQTFSSLGNRIFDVSIQGNVLLKNFNIMENASGVGKGIYKDFNVNVNGSTLEIHLYWSGKGTTAIPDRGVYGPLISAIAVTPNFDPHTGLPIVDIVGIAVGSSIFIMFILVLWMRGRFGGKDTKNKELRDLLQTGHFSLKQIKTATNDFNHLNKIGEGGFGPVYKGVLSNGTTIAVKQLSAKSKQGNREFVNEIGMISALQHPNLVKLFGCCIEGKELLLIYEYMENNCLARALFGHQEQRLKLDWPKRKKICIGIARGLAYLHEESSLKIVHRDIKATNVLLDKDLNAKISDFGLAKLDEEENTHISTRVAGTIGYMAPEYAMRGFLTDKADVYSFGVVTLEIVSGKSNMNYQPKEEFVYLLDWAYFLKEQGNLLELVDPDLGSNCWESEVMNMLNVALLCTNPSPTLRPPMSLVVSMLEGKTPIQATLVKPNSAEKAYSRFKAIEKLLHDSGTHLSLSSPDNLVQRSTLSMEGPCVIDTTMSVHERGDDHDHSSSTGLFSDLQE